jgi:hypothetical protein
MVGVIRHGPVRIHAYSTSVTNRWDIVFDERLPMWRLGKRVVASEGISECLQIHNGGLRFHAEHQTDESLRLVKPRVGRSDIVGHEAVVDSVIYQYDVWVMLLYSVHLH